MTHTAAELKQTGIYAIINLDTGKKYIGSAARTFRERWSKHKLELRKGIHHSSYLQRSWNKHTEFRFEFKILEFVPPEYCLQREQWWMDLYGSYIEDYGYNLCPKAGSQLGYKRSEETKAKMSAHKKSEEHKKKVAQANKGKQRTVEQKLFMAKSKNPEGYNILSPNGEIFHFYNMSDFCKEYNLTISKVSQVLSGKEKSHKGWRKL